MKTDPWETSNLAALPEYEKTVRRLQEKLLRLRMAHHDGTETCQQNFPEMFDQYKKFWEYYEN